jgi:DNA modification methylase
MIEINKIYNGDCLEKMKDIPDGSCDFICTDLPYSVLCKSNENSKWDNIIPFEPLWEQYERIIKDNGAIVLFAQGLFTAKLILSNEKLYRYSLVWDKGDRVSGFLNANRMPLRSHEDIVVFYKSLPTYNPQMTKGNKNHKRGNHGTMTNNCYGEFKQTETILTDLKYPKSILRFNKPFLTKNHPTEKPVELIQYLIRTYTNEGETVLDSCCGSGTTAIACIREKRNWICIEKDPKFYEVAKKRIENELNQPTLF